MTCDSEDETVRIASLSGAFVAYDGADPIGGGQGVLEIRRCPVRDVILVDVGDAIRMFSAWIEVPAVSGLKMLEFPELHRGDRLEGSVQLNKFAALSSGPGYMVTRLSEAMSRDHDVVTVEISRDVHRMTIGIPCRILNPILRDFWTDRRLEPRTSVDCTAPFRRRTP